MEFTIWLSGNSEEDDEEEEKEEVVVEEEEEETWAMTSLRAFVSVLQARTRAGMRRASRAQPIRQRPKERRYWPPATGSLR
jgi:hypothetical protein